MRRSISNAFTEGDGSGSTPRGGALASPLATLEARLAQHAYGTSLELSPFRLADAMSIWPTLSPSHVSWNIVLDLEPAVIEAIRGASMLQPLTGRLQFATAEVINGNQLVLDDAQLGELVHALPLRRLRVVRICGPVESLDGQMIQRWLDAGASALEAELRAVAMMDIHDSALTLQVREPSQAYAFIAENFRQYLAAVLDEPARSLALPDLWQVEQLLSINSGVAVRPQETDVFSGSVDIGICSNGPAQDRPAGLSIIYDRPSNSWHGER